jgi:chromosome segregation protein
LKLQSLELVGFKSFPRKTRLEFHDGITAIVGPNGCGKSNLVDAIRWVLGEQNPRMLRGERMDDAIFNGTATRKPVGFAEVSLTVSNEKGELPLSFSEVAFTRCLYRTGESQYLVNKSQVRLKDIMDLTAGTGMGLTEYSLIDQKLVDLILDDSTTSRRELIEEAAGVAGYRRKRHLAAKKLEAVEADLSRLSDIITEVERNVTSLDRHVKKAKRYQYYRERQRHLDLNLASRKLSRLSREEREVSGRLESCEERVRQLKSEVEEATRKISTSRELTGKLEEEIKRTRIEIEASQARKNQLGGDLLLARERLRLARERLSEIAGEREEVLGRKESLLTERSRIEERLSEAEERLLVCESAYRERETAAAEVARKLEEKERLIASLRKGYDEEERASLREEAGKLVLREEIGTLLKRKAEIEYALEGESGEVEKGVTEEGSLLEEIGKLGQIVGDLQAELERVDRERRELLVRRETFAQMEREKELALYNVNARLETIGREVQEGGCSRDAQGAIRLCEQQSKRVWLLSEIFDIREGYADILCKVFKDYRDTVVTENLDTALGIASSLRESGRGTVTIVPLDIVHSGEAVLSGVEEAVPVSSLIECSGEFAALRDHLFGNVFIVPASAHMGRLVSLSNEGPDFVSADGSFMARDGVLTVGPLPERPFESLEGLKAQGDEIMRQIAEARSGLEEVGKTIDKVEQGRSELETSLRGHSSQLQGKESRAHQISLELTSRKREEERRRAEYEGIVSLLEEKGSLLLAIEETLSDRAVRLEEERELSSMLSGELHVLRELERTERRSLADLKVEVVALSSMLREAKILSDNQRDQMMKVEAELRARDSEERGLGERILALETAIRDLENGLVAESARIEGLAGNLREEEEHLLRGRKEAEDAGSGVEESRRLLDDLSGERSEMLLRRQELTMTMHSLQRQIEEEYAVSVDMLPAEAQETEELDLAKLEEDLAEIKRKIHLMGSVNMAALEEYQNEKQRFDFLSTQRDDLVRSKDDLEKTIRRLNKIARELFQGTFQQVRENFTKIFLTLFRGGEADLELGDEHDPLESDIRIFARPSGKKVQSIELLSGGERALSAIAFLFSLYLAKSSPFCMFDEVDAPLDDANVLRFTSMLQEYRGKTQFVVITHNKRTMEAADYMYGVSMEEPGVSKIVSVKLDGNGEKRVEKTEELTIVDEAVL